MTKQDLNIYHSGRLDRGISYAEACFETFRVIDGEVFSWQQHLSRLVSGLECFGMVLGEDELTAVRKALFTQAAKTGNDTLVRVTVSGGAAEWGLLQEGSREINVYIQCIPYVLKTGESHLSTVPWPFELQAKQAKFTSDYALTLRAMQQWKAGGLSEKETPLICMHDRVLSTHTANIMIYRNNRWHTPHESDGGLLAGTIRNHLVAESVVERSTCPVTWLDDCDAIALTNSGFFIQPVSMVNGRILNNEHPAFELLSRALRGCSGVPKL